MRRSVAVATASLLALATLGAVGVPGAGASASRGGPETFTATLVVLPEHTGHVEVRKSGKEAFKQADDGAKLREGDTVRTDDQGQAEVDYTDDSYTRLDYNTTFTIVTLTDDQGVRQIAGSLDVGRTWNRTEALTESQSYEQEAGGATAAVTGTAFSLECTKEEQAKLCKALAVLHGVLLTSSDEEQQKLLAELDLCDISDGQLCDAVDPQTIKDMIDNAWTQLNLQRDLIERGLGPGPFTDVAGAAATQPTQVGGDVAVSPDAYTPQVGGQAATRVAGGGATGNLPYTGSNDTVSWLLVGLALAVVGAVLVLATRRRASVLQRR